MPRSPGCVSRRATMFPMVVALLVITGRVPPAFAQYQIDFWTADDGLPQNIITGIHQTGDGYLWIATLDGLARFDGARFEVFNTGNSPGMESNRFTSLHEDRRGDLWLGTEVGVVTRYTRDRFVTYTKAHGLQGGRIQDFTGDEEGRLWVLSGSTIRRWAPSRERFVEVEAPDVTPGFQRFEWGDRYGFWGRDRMGLRLFLGGRWELLPLSPSLDITISRAARAQDGAIWVAAPDGRLVRIANGKHDAFRAQPHWSDAPSSPSPRPQVAWRGPSGEPWKLDVGADLKRSLALSSSERRVTIDPAVLYEDREESLWLGTSGQGLVRVRKQLVTTYSQPQGLAARNVYPIAQDRAGTIWIGTWPTGLSRFQDGRFTRYTVRDGLAPGGLTALREDRDGRLWIATHAGVQTFYDGRFTEVERDGIPSTATVQVIHQDAVGAIWLGTDNGLVRREPGRTTLFTTRDGLASDDVRVIIDAPASGGLWIGSYGGLTKWRDGRFTAWTPSDDLPNITVRALYEDAEGILWIGTYDTGLVRFDEGEFTRYTTRVGLFNDGVFQILDDGRGNFWMSSNRGIHRVRRRELEEFAAGARGEITSVAYGRRDGMLNAECNGGLWPAGIRARDGTLWFPTQDGVAVIDPASVTTNLRPPAVVIETFLLDRQSVDLPTAERSLRIPPGGTNLEIQYTGLTFINPERVRFKYRLAGLDADWVDAGTRRAAYYSYVPPGRYTFTVVAANQDGVWNTEGASLALVVMPPFYRTWWFLALTLTGAVGLVAVAWRRREARVRRAHAIQQAFSRQLIASQEAERQRIAADLHDGLGQRLVIIKNLAMLAGSSDPNHATSRLEEISSEATQAIGEVREISRNLRPHQLDHLGLTKALDALVRKAAGASPVRFAAELDDLDGLFPKEAEIHVYRVVQECLSNIMRHAGADTAWITARRSSSRLLFTIRDDGRGFAPPDDGDAAARGFGLLGMEERVAPLGGRIAIRSAPGEGTRVTIIFDLKRLREASGQARIEAAGARTGE